MGHSVRRNNFLHTIIKGHLGNSRLWNNNNNNNEEDENKKNMKNKKKTKKNKRKPKQNKKKSKNKKKIKKNKSSAAARRLEGRKTLLHDESSS